MSARRVSRDNKGARKLRAAIKRLGSQAEICRALDVDSAVVSRWASGERLPEPIARARLEDLYGIFWRSWDEAISTRRKAA